MPKSVKTLIQLEGLRAAHHPRARTLRHLDERLRAQEVVRRDDGRAADGEETGQLALRREPAADRKLAVRDRRSQPHGEFAVPVPRRQVELPDQRQEPLALWIGPRAVPGHTTDYRSRRESDARSRETYLRQLNESHARVPEVTIAWQGGEPTLMGLDFFRRSVELADQVPAAGQRATYTIQSGWPPTGPA